jgi:hypothetical protein
MSVFQKAQNEMAYLKAGFYGEAGSGKSFTSSQIAIGLVKYIKAKKPVMYFDTETGSDFLIRQFTDAGIELHTAKTRAFSDLLVAVDEAEKSASVMIIDSITHVWNELIESYMKKLELKRLSLKHWIPLKTTWREFTTRYVNSKLHVIICGRSADKWDEVEDEDGAKELRKVGTKMRTETELAYEPSLLVELELIQASAHIGGALVHRAHVRKDRFDVINGQRFDNPGFEAFLPHISLLNLGGEHKALEPGRDSTAMFERNDVGARKMETREILIEKIGNEIKLIYPGQTEADKTARLKLMAQIFQTHSWTEICTRRKNEELQAGLDAIIALKGDEAALPVDEKKSKKGGK